MTRRLTISILCLLVAGCSLRDFSAWHPFQKSANNPIDEPPSPTKQQRSSVIDTNGNDILIGKAWNGMQIYSNDYSHELWYSPTTEVQPYIYGDFKDKSSFSARVPLVIGYKTNLLQRNTNYITLDAGTLRLLKKDFPNGFYEVSVNWKQ